MCGAIAGPTFFIPLPHCGHASGNQSLLYLIEIIRLLKIYTLCLTEGIQDVPYFCTLHRNALVRCA